MNFCPNCGNQLELSARYCGSCGENIAPFQQSKLSETVQRTVVTESSPSFQNEDLKFRMKNSQRPIVNLWYFFGLLFLFCMFLPSIIGLDGFDGGFAMTFTAGFMVIISIVVIVIYRSRANQLDRILSGEGRIAVWRYSQDEWKRFITRDFEEDKKLKRMLFFLIAGISVVIGIILTIAYEDFLFVPIILGLIVVVAIPAIWAPHYRYRKLLHSEAQALIAENGVIVGKMFHLWIKLGASLDFVSINEENEPNLIEFRYSMPARHGRQEEIARIPVPKGKSMEAVRIVERFNRKLS